MKDWSAILSPTVQSIPPSGIRRFFDIAAEMEDVISLGVGEPDFVTPWTIRESCVYGLEQGYTSYTANRGMLELRQEIARLQKDRYSLDYDPATDVLVTVGVSEALDLAMRAVLSRGRNSDPRTVLCFLQGVCRSRRRHRRSRSGKNRKRISHHAEGFSGSSHAPHQSASHRLS